MDAESFSLEGDYGEFRRIVEGVGARTKQIGSGHPSNCGVSRARSHGSIPSELAEAETNGFRGGSQEDGGSPESAMGEGKPFLALGAGPIEPIRMPERQGVRQSITPH